MNDYLKLVYNILKEIYNILLYIPKEQDENYLLRA
jgi:hypothetical protein